MATNYGAIGTGAAGGAISGASIGSTMGPYGTVIGGAIGGIAGGLGGYFQSQGQEKNEQALDSVRKQIAEQRRKQYQMRMEGLQQALNMYGPYTQWASQVTGVNMTQPLQQASQWAGNSANTYFGSGG